MFLKHFNMKPKIHCFADLDPTVGLTNLIHNCMPLLILIPMEKRLNFDLLPIGRKSVLPAYASLLLMTADWLQLLCLVAGCSLVI